MFNSPGFNSSAHKRVCLKKLCGVCDLFTRFYDVTSPESKLFEHKETVHFLWFSMSLFQGGQLILASSVCLSFRSCSYPLLIVHISF